MRSLILLLAVVPAALGGCADGSRALRIPQEHIILVDLNDPADWREFASDTFALMQGQGVAAILTGPRLAAAAPGGLQDFDMGVRIGLMSAEANAALPNHPSYVALMDKWRPRTRSIRTASFGPSCEPEIAGE